MGLWTRGMLVLQQNHHHKQAVSMEEQDVEKV